MKKLLPLPFDFLVYYPFKNYLNGLVRTPQQMAVCLVLCQKGTAMFCGKIKGKGNSYYSSDIHTINGGLTVDSFDPDMSDSLGFLPMGTFQKDVFKRFALGRNGPCSVLIEHPKMYLNYHSMDEAEGTVKNIFDMLSEDPREVIPNWTTVDTFIWGAFNDKLDIAPPSSRASSLGQLFLFGIPSGYADFLCEWGFKTEQIINSIIPYPLSVAAWFLRAWPPREFFFLVVPGAATFHLFAFQDSRCLQYFAFPNDNAVKGEIISCVEETSESVSRPSGIFDVLLWPTLGFPPSRLADEFPSSTDARYTVVDDQAGDEAFPNSSSRPVAARLCDWVCMETIQNYSGDPQNEVLDILNPHVKSAVTKKGIAPINISSTRK